MSTFTENARFSHYLISSKLGQGGMGEVFLARDLELERRVALKILPADLAGDDENIRRFVREAKAASALNHPNILTIYEVGHEDGLRYISTEYVHGETLRQRIRRGSISRDSAIEIASQIGAALNAAHSNGIVHRDIKPENIMIREDGLVKVLDFGLAKLHETESPRQTGSDALTEVQINTERGIVMGTAQYLSPEQARGKKIDGRSDIWSLGVILYEMLAGVRPFEGETTTDVLAGILKSEPEPLSNGSDATSEELARIVRKALEKDADKRYQKATDFLQDLKELASDRAPGRDSGRSELLGSETLPTMRLEPRQIATLENLRGSGPDLIASDAVTGKDRAASRRRNILLLSAAAVLVAVMGVAAYYKFTSPGSLNSIAVLPFQNGSGDPNLDYLSDGISESIIDRLTLLPNLKVIARNSSFKFRGQDAAADAAKALGIRAVVTGRVIQRADQLSVRVELVDAQDNRQLWSQVFNRNAGEAQSIQEEISLGIAERLRALEPSIGPAEMTQRDLVKPRAFEQLLRARFALRQYTPESTRKAIELYEGAINEEPGYPDAHAELAYAYRISSSNAFVDPAEANPKAARSAEKALQLDDRIALAHLVLAEVERDNWNWAGAEVQYRRSSELNPNLAEGHEAYAIYLSVLGRHDDAIAEMKRAAELDPLRLQSHVSLGAVYYNARRYDEASGALRKALDLDANSPVAHAWLGIVNAGRGSFGDAVADYRRAIELGDNTTATRCYYGYALARNGQPEEAREISRVLGSGSEFVSPVGLAVLYTGLGEKAAALESLEKAFRERDPQLQYLNVEPHFDSLRGEARFQAVVTQVGLSR
ncbi:MAG TPA: protein kinase [Pyrinomonadaceae bacterium]|nr:protein kinase [Pyrinomonadaceae bacterium]